MLSTPAPVRRRTVRRAAPAAYAPVPSARGTEGAIIPYDHAATFELTGRPGNIVQGVINVANDGIFVATAIGYGFEEQRTRPVAEVAPGQLGPVIPGDLTLAELPLSALLDGFRISPSGARFVFNQAGANQVFTNEPLARAQLFGAPGRSVLEHVNPPQELSFFFSIVDSGTGREFQDQPTHNLASLGKSDGDRPFRLLARPLSFMPRSTLRLQIAEHTEGAHGTLFIVLYGYKVLASACAEPVARRWEMNAQGCAVEQFGEPDARAIPFDYVTTFELTGNPGNPLEDEISVNVEGGFVATSIGYGLAVEDTGVNIALPDPNTLPAGSPLRALLQGWQAANGIDLSQFPLRFFPPDALLDGLRLRPNFLRVALGNNGALANQLPFSLIGRIFERLNRPENVSFRYEIFDGGTGHELQNRPLHNVAGLGIANGDRPFKKLARPMSFLPRSTIRVKVEERFGRGTLFIAFQGYKLLGTTAQGGRR